jgi:Uma2 family endonuclease
MQNSLNLDITTSETKVISFLDYKNYLYPDVVVVDGKPYFEDDNKDVLVNPTLLVEVLSESTEAFDRGEKFKSYRQIKSLKEYILINSMKESIEQFYCDENGRWQIGDALNEGVLKLQSLPIELSFDEVYFNVVFEAEKLSDTAL